MYKRQLQLRGVYPMMYNYNGQIIPMYSNQEFNVPQNTGRSHRSEPPKHDLYAGTAFHRKRTGKRLEESSRNQFTAPFDEKKNKSRRKGDLTGKADNSKYSIEKRLRDAVARMHVGTTISTEKPTVLSKKRDLSKQNSRRQVNQYQIERTTSPSTPKTTVKIDLSTALPRQVVSTSPTTTTTTTMTTTTTTPTTTTMPTTTTTTTTTTTKPTITTKATTTTNNVENSNTISSQSFPSATETTTQFQYHSSSDMIPMSTEFTEIDTVDMTTMDITTMESVTESTTETLDDKLVQNDGTTLNVPDTMRTLNVEENQFSTLTDYYEMTTEPMTTVFTTETSLVDHSTQLIEAQNIDELDVNLNVAENAVVGKLDKMSYFSDTNFDRLEDEYKMDQLTPDLIQRIKLKNFSSNERKVLRSIFRRKWQHIRNEAKDLENFTNDNDPILMEILDNGQ